MEVADGTVFLGYGHCGKIVAVADCLGRSVLVFSSSSVEDNWAVKRRKDWCT